MKIGVVFPQTEFGDDPAAITDYAQTAEGLGFTHVLAYDHVLGAHPDRPGGWDGPYTHDDAFHEPFTLFSFMAAQTTRLGFITGIIVLPQRQAQLVAKQAAQVDIFCRGNFRLGIGVGWNRVEIQAMGENPANRGSRTDEQLELMRALWTQPLVNFKGKWHQLPNLGINPLPVQRPIPIWFGGHAEAMMRRVAKFGGGWLPGYRKAEDAQRWLEQLDQHLESHGRTRAEIGIESRLQYKNGSADIWGATLEGWQNAGATHASINTMGCGFEVPQEHITALKNFARAVGVQP